MVKTRGNTYSHLMVAHDRNQYYLGQKGASYPSLGSSYSREVVSRARPGQGAPNHPCTETGTQGAGVPSLVRGTTALSMDSKKGNPNQNIAEPHMITKEGNWTTFAKANEKVVINVGEFSILQYVSMTINIGQFSITPLVSISKYDKESWMYPSSALQTVTHNEASKQLRTPGETKREKVTQRRMDEYRIFEGSKQQAARSGNLGAQLHFSGLEPINECNYYCQPPKGFSSTHINRIGFSKAFTTAQYLKPKNHSLPLLQKQKRNRNRGN